ncbi:hypothetical protein PPGU19_061870 (plasmid) [Paraburkholderia sp. PGU19]|uniref:hypothetical protein n=1 Tax=Paraburkholderia sp. PGU19 TaxID=2735434 RepID=UPI0015D98BF8|nr:hypothetical protein [Paraburkholderia sp. PGU19]BCG01619.1 hypothetical protein PPGU19_061870 [Paraburkholderia sp. PGU19]
MPRFTDEDRHAYFEFGNAEQQIASACGAAQAYVALTRADRIEFAGDGLCDQRFETRGKPLDRPRIFPISASTHVDNVALLGQR